MPSSGQCNREATGLARPLWHLIPRTRPATPASTHCIEHWIRLHFEHLSRHLSTGHSSCSHHRRRLKFMISLDLQNPLGIQEISVLGCSLITSLIFPFPQIYQWNGAHTHETVPLGSKLRREHQGILEAVKSLIYMNDGEEPVG